MQVLGLMSGTSADGVDAVLASFSGPLSRPRWKVLASHSTAYSSSLRERLVAVGQGRPLSAEELLTLAEDLTEHQAKAAQACDPLRRAQLVGCHGQTLWHRPPEGDRRGASWQLLQGPLLAELLGTAVVFDFRGGDLALGGHGAPLVPATDAALLGRIDGWRALLNLGGIANLTMIPPRGGPERRSPVRGWDCGPANTLVDLAVARFSGGDLNVDADGAWAGRGRIDETVIRHWLQEPYFQLPHPKSTGRELFGADDLERRLRDMGETIDPADALATLTAFSAAVVAQDLGRGPRPLELLVAGGGTRNLFLMEQLRRRCRGMRVQSLGSLGIPEEQREALGFALLAWWRLKGHPGSLPSVTGARAPAVLGVLASPPGIRNRPGSRS